MKRGLKLGTPEADRMIAAMDNNLDPESETFRPRKRFVQRSFRDEEATDAQYDKIADAYERKIYGE